MMKWTFITFLGFAWIANAAGLGPATPGSLLPPIGKSGQDIQKKTAESGAEDLDAIFDLEDPSTLLEQDEMALTPAKKQKQALNPNDKYTLPPPKSSKTIIPLIPPLATLKKDQVLKVEEKKEAPVQEEAPHPPLLSAMNPAPPPPPLVIPDLAPIAAGVGMPATNREPAAAPKPAEVTPLIPVPKGATLVPMAGIPDIAIILSNSQFFPSKVKLREGTQTRLLFTTTNKKPAALVMEKLQIQRWIAKEPGPNATSEVERAKWEVNRELSSTRVTEIVFDPKEGTYNFHDAITGASGEIEVEKK